MEPQEYSLIFGEFKKLIMGKIACDHAIQAASAHYRHLWGKEILVGAFYEKKTIIFVLEEGRNTARKPVEFSYQGICSKCKNRVMHERDCGCCDLNYEEDLYGYHTD